MADAAQPALIWAENLKCWETSVQALMGASPPEHDETKALQDICSILNTLGANRDESHIFLPEAGGLDLHGARPGYEPDTIELAVKGPPASAGGLPGGWQATP